METYVAALDRVLSVSPFEEDHRNLEGIFRAAGWRQRAEAAPTLATGRRLLQDPAVSVVICEEELRPGSWRDLLHCATDRRNPPMLIVTSRLADEALWAEALNLGAFDIVAKPFHAAEVLRIVGFARAHWAGQPPRRAVLRASAQHS